MTCEIVPLGNGTNMIVCGPTRRCACGNRHTLLCDWKVPGKKSGTCDKPLCASCTTSPAPGKDLCPTHGAEWAARRASTATQEGSPDV